MEDNNKTITIKEEANLTDQSINQITIETKETPISIDTIKDQLKELSIEIVGGSLLLVLGTIVVIVRREVKKLKETLDNRLDNGGLISIISGDEDREELNKEDNNTIYALLGQLKQQSNCDRIYIIEFERTIRHNKVSLEKNKLKIRFEVKENYIVSKKDSLKKISKNKLEEITTVLIIKELIKLEELRGDTRRILRIENEDISELLGETGIEVIGLIELLKDQDSLFGVLVIDYMYRDTNERELNKRDVKLIFSLTLILIRQATEK